MTDATENAVSLRYRISRSLSLAFVLDEPALQRLDAFLSGNGGKREYEVELSDSATVDCPTIADVRGLPNVKHHSIVSIEASARWPGSSGIHASFGSSTSYIGPIRYGVIGDEKNAYDLSRRFEQFVASVTQWYSPMTRAGVGTFMILTVVLFLSFLVWAVASHFATLSSEPPTITLSDTAVVVAVMAFFFVAPWLLNAARGWLFPASTFAIGQGLDRHRIRGYVRSGVLGAIGLAVIGGIIVNLLTHH